MPLIEHRKAPRIRFHDEEQVQISFSWQGNHYSGQICDYSRFGLGARLNVDLDPAAENCISDICITAYGSKRKLGTGKIVRLYPDKETHFLGIVLDNEFVDLDFLAENQKIVLQEDEFNTIRLHFSYLEFAKEEIKRFIADFTYGLATYKKCLDELDRKFENEPASLRESLFHAATTGIGKQLMGYLDSSIGKLGELVADYSRREHEQNGFYVRRLLWPYIVQAAFLKRTNLKPRGYPGDSIMMEMCYKNEYVGDTSFGRILHKHPLENAAAQAVRERRKMINQELNRIVDASPADVKVMSVACGPAWELRDFFRESANRNKIDLVLLDQDESALQEARAGIETAPGFESFRVEYLQDSVRTLLKTSNPQEKYGQFDFIYSMGLFDYLTQPVARAVLTKLYSITAPGGKLIIGNYHQNNPSKVYMEYILDWVLFYRTEESFLELTRDFPGEFTAEAVFDATGSQMFLHIVKGDGE